MSGIQEAEKDLRRGVAVADDEVRDSGWQQLDLDLMLASLPRAPRPDVVLLSAPASGSVRSFPQTGEELAGVLGRPARRRVPASAFVSIGFGRTGPVPRYPVSSPPFRRFANDNELGSGDKRSVWRDLFFLMVLAATVVGAFWSGRMHGYQKVIVVPGPSSFYSVVT